MIFRDSKNSPGSAFRLVGNLNPRFDDTLLCVLSCWTPPNSYICRPGVLIQLRTAPHRRLSSAGVSPAMGTGDLWVLCITALLVFHETLEQVDVVDPPLASVSPNAPSSRYVLWWQRNFGLLVPEESEPSAPTRRVPKDVTGYLRENVQNKPFGI